MAGQQRGSKRPASSKRTRPERDGRDERRNVVTVDGEVTQAFPDGFFRVVLPIGHEVLAHLSGKMRTNHIRVTVGDTVVVELSPYDLTRGRIIFRKRVGS